METPFFFTPTGAAGELRRFAVLHKPERVLSDRGWVFCHPFAEEKLWSHRVYVDFARQLAARGVPVLRFDYRGYGDSEGEFEAFNVNDQVEDIQLAVQQLQRDVPELQHCGLFGLRYGASLALLAAQGSDTIDRMILWDPVIDLAQYLQDQLRSNLTTQMVLHGKVITNRDELIEKIRAGERVNIDGYELGNPFFDTASEVNLMPVAADFKGQVQVVEITRSAQSAPRADIQQLVSALKNVSHERVQEVQFWKEIKPFVKSSPALTTCSLNWLEK